MAVMTSISSSGNYPSDAGVFPAFPSGGLRLFDVQMGIDGTVGSGADFTVETLDINDNWVSTSLTLSTAGVVQGIVEGKAVRRSDTLGSGASGVAGLLDVRELYLNCDTNA